MMMTMMMIIIIVVIIIVIITTIITIIMMMNQFADNHIIPIKNPHQHSLGPIDLLLQYPPVINPANRKPTN